MFWLFPADNASSRATSSIMRDLFATIVSPGLRIESVTISSRRPLSSFFTPHLKVDQKFSIGFKQALYGAKRKMSMAS